MKPESQKSLFQRVPQFVSEVKQETKKVTWPSRRETVLTTVFVLVFSVIASLYFLVVDKIIISVLELIRGF